MKTKQFIAPFGQLVSQNNLLKWTGRRMIFPFYHTISDQELPYISNLYPLRSVGEFKNDLNAFCEYFTPVGINEVYDRVLSKCKKEKPAFHLSFDDGLKEVHEIIAPILKERGIPATFFVNTNFIDNKKLFYRYKVGLILDRLKQINAEDNNQMIRSFLQEYSKWNGNLQISLMHLDYHDQSLINEIAQILEIDFDDWLSKNKPYLTTEQIKDLIKKGFGIGSHSVDHPRFRTIDLSQQKVQLENSFKFLEEKFDVSERLFSFPFGDEDVKAELFDWMYTERKCKLSFGVSGIKNDYCPFHLHRIPMDECQVEPREFIKSEYLYFMLKSIFNKNQIYRN